MCSEGGWVCGEGDECAVKGEGCVVRSVGDQCTVKGGGVCGEGGCVS